MQNWVLSDALYFRLDDSRVVESEAVQDGVVLDYDANNQVVGIEILGVVNRIDPSDLRSMHFEVAGAESHGRLTARYRDNRDPQRR